MFYCWLCDHWHSIADQLLEVEHVCYWCGEQRACPPRSRVDF